MYTFYWTQKKKKVCQKRKREKKREKTALLRFLGNEAVFLKLDFKNNRVTSIS
ncbi:mCG147201 [Mus musculus]|nr:mCG147201 [Mus musculus]